MSLHWNVEEHGLEVGREANTNIKYLWDADKVGRLSNSWNLLVTIAVTIVTVWLEWPGVCFVTMWRFLAF